MEGLCKLSDVEEEDDVVAGSLVNVVIVDNGMQIAGKTKKRYVERMCEGPASVAKAIHEDQTSKTNAHWLNRCSHSALRDSITNAMLFFYGTSDKFAERSIDWLQEGNGYLDMIVTQLGQFIEMRSNAPAADTEVVRHGYGQLKLLLGKGSELDFFKLFGLYTLFIGHRFLRQYKSTRIVPSSEEDKLMQRILGINVDSVSPTKRPPETSMSRKRICLESLYAE